MMDFKQTENTFKELKAQFESGKLTEAEFKSQLEELMIQDVDGNWWIIGYETELWYRHDGEKWVQSEPQGRISGVTTHPKWMSIFWITLGWAIGGYLGWIIGIGLTISPEFSGAISGAISGFATALILRREKILSKKEDLLWIILGWVFGWTIGEIIDGNLYEGLGLATGGILSGAIFGGIGGFATALTLMREKMLSTENDMLWIILGWVTSGAISWISFDAYGNSWANLGAINGALGGFLTVLVIRRNQNNRGEVLSRS